LDNYIVLSIQAILAPALGISATALLLLGLSNRYSSLLNRIRILNSEKRKLIIELTEKGEFNYHDNVRYISVSKQIDILFLRCKLNRDSILCLQISIMIFVLTSVLIGFNLFIESKILDFVPIITFVIGMIFVFLGIAFSAKEVQKSYKMILIELKAD
jgi:hypothetical protein